MDRIDRMKLYCCIIETGQLSLAADRMDLSKGTVSKQLAKLEASLGGRLLNRTTRRLAPTEAGISYYERVKHILESVEEAECVVTGLTVVPQGTLKINAPMAFGSHHLGDLLTQYQRRYPQVKINIHLSDRQVDVVEEGYDIVLRIAILEDSSLIMRRLAPCPIVLCASHAYLEQYGEPQKPEDLKQHHCLTYSYANSIKYWSFKNTQGEKKHIAVTSVLHANNGHLICDAMEHGMGIALLPLFIAGKILNKGNIKTILPNWSPESPDISLLYPSSKHLSAKVRAFVDLSVEYFSSRFKTVE
ncbi:MAG: LysR family transcriptional regulator [Cocleimonas sp.]|nr:LysR family transcriptional regulator [Cocleimonas sp.]